ncbi:MAG: hypothetical protein ICV84_25725, partial [Flavisolibacter sp.]|nr:hypothetical protein [Flavisolibacter sp.]
MSIFLIQWLLLSFASLGLINNEPNTAALKRAVNVVHPFYVSVTEINHNSKEKTLEISCKAFAEDMEDILKKNYKTTVDLENANQKTQNNKLVNDYITHHLNLITDG